MSLPELLQRIDELKAELTSLLPMDPVQQDRLWQKLRLEWNYNSNHIEGNTLTYGETFLLLVHGKTAGDHSVREIDEMRAHNVAITMVQQWAQEKERPIMEADIRDVNKLLLKEPFWKSARTADGQETSIQIIPGEYKKQGNSVLQPDGTIFHYAKPEEVPAKMMDLMTWYATDGQALHPLLRATEWHHRFILIHPFGDGNGRVARLMVNYILMHAGSMPLVVKSADKGQYLTALKKADAGDMIPFAEYLATQEIWALELALRAAHGDDLEERGDWVKEAQLAYEKASATKGALDRARKVFHERMVSALRLNLEPFIAEVAQVILVYRKFYVRTEAKWMYEQVVRKQSFPHETLWKALQPEKLIEFFATHDPKPYLQLHIKFAGDKLEAGARETQLVLRWEFGEDTQRFTCAPLKDAPEELPYSIPLTVRPLDTLERAGKWMLQKATGKPKN